MASPSSRSDRQRLIDSQAFLRRIARALVADEQRAEDLAQEAAVLALESPPESGVTRTWLARLLRQRAWSLGRSERRRVVRERARPKQRESASPEAVNIQLEMQRRVVDAIDALPEAYKSVLFLRFYEDLGPKAIAEQLDLPVSTVKTRLGRGLARLRAELDERHDGDRAAWSAALALRATEPRASAAGALSLATSLKWGGVLLVVGLCASSAALARWWREPTRTLAEAGGVDEGQTRGVESPSEAALLEPAPVESTRLAPQPTSSVPKGEEILLHVRGLVEGESGSIDVEVEDPRGERPRLHSRHDAASTLSIDAAPFFVAGGEPPPRLVAVVDHARYLRAEAAILVSSEPGKRPIEGWIDLVPAVGFVRGQLVDDTQEAVAQAQVELYAMHGTSPVHDPVDVGLCDSDGRFVLRAGEVGEYVVLAFSVEENRDSTPVNQRVRGRPASVRTPVVAGETVELELVRLSEGVAIEGQVHCTLDGERLRGAVRAVLDGPENVLRYRYRHGLTWSGDGFEHRTRTVDWDEDGAFRVGWLAQASYRFEGQFNTGSDHVTLSHNDDAVRVTAPAHGVSLDFGFRVVRVFVHRARVAVPAARITLHVSSAEGGFNTGLQANENGELTLLLRSEIGLRVEAEAPGLTRAEAEVILPEIGQESRVELELVPQELVSLSIHPVGQAAAQLADAIVDWALISASGDNPWWAENPLQFTSAPPGRHPGDIDASIGKPEQRLGADGVRVLDGLVPGKYLVWAKPQERGAEKPCYVVPVVLRAELKDAATSVDWPVKIGGRLRLNFLGTSPGVKARVFDDSGSQVHLRFEAPRTSTRRGAGGSAPRIPGLNLVSAALPAGAYRLELTRADGTRSYVPFALEAGRTLDLQVDVDAR